jgi:hypothetical protein
MDDSLKAAQTNALDEARAAIQRAFESGDLDDDAATISLLAITLGTRRMDEEHAREAATRGSESQQTDRQTHRAKKT